MRRVSFVPAFLLLAGLAGASGQAAEPGALTIGVTGGTLGVGPQLGYRISPLLALRADAVFLSVSHGVSVNDIRYKGHLRLSSFGGTIDLYPFGGGFRISAGARVDKNRVRLHAMPASPVTVGDEVFTPEEIGNLSGDIHVRDLAPIATLGYSTQAAHGLRFGIDAGAMFQGSPRITDLMATGTLANDPLFHAQLDEEADKISAKIRKYRIYPVVQASIVYAF